ncbi:MAG: FhaA domain-containing protein [Pseudonocardiaceae bacterium]
MGKVQRFERRLQGMVGDAFARVFGGSVVPQEVAQALQREADDNARPLAGGRVLAPNRYTVTLGATDHDRLAGDEQRVVRMLKDCVQDHLRDHAWDVYGDVVVALKRSATLHTGQFRTSSSVDPDAPQPRTAGDLAMSQQHGEHPEDAQWSPAPHQGYGPDQGGYAAHRHGYPVQCPPEQDYRNPSGDRHGYDQGGYDADYAQRHHAADQGYQRTYGDQGYGPGYGYQPDGHGDQGYSAGQSYATQGYDAQGYDTQGYQPPAVPAGSQHLIASLTVEDGSNRQCQLVEGSTVVGRGQDAQFRLPDTGVSRRHLEIIWDGWTATLADLGSTNGTTVNGTPVQTWQLADGDVVRVGHSSLVFRTQG